MQHQYPISKTNEKQKNIFKFDAGQMQKKNRIKKLSVKKLKKSLKKFMFYFPASSSRFQ